MQFIAKLFDHLSRVIDKKRRVGADELHKRSLNWEAVERPPLVLTYPVTDELPFHPYPHRDIFQNPEKMLFNELVYAFNTSIAASHVLPDDLAYTVRANFGTVIIASMFGAMVEQVDDNPPWVRHDSDIDACLATVLESDPRDFSRGWGPRVIKTYQLYRSALEQYPPLNEVVKIVLPDLQSPFDTLELVAGSGLFEELVVNPERVKKALAVVADAQINFARHLQPYINDGPAGFSHQHATMIKGNILLRNDSVILISPGMYREHVAPHDERVLNAMGGGGIHSCGKIQDHAEIFLELPSLQCIDLGQPQLNDLDFIYGLAKPRKIPLIRVSASEEELTSRRIIQRFPTGVSLGYHAKSLADARRIMKSYRNDHI